MNGRTAKLIRKVSAARGNYRLLRRRDVTRVNVVSCCDLFKAVRS